MSRDNQQCAVLDDNEDSRAVLRFFLEGEGFEVREFGSKHQFLESLRSETPDLALVDLWLPDGSGLEIPAELKDYAGKGFPVVAVSADAMPHAVLQARESGFAGFITKPIDFDSLRTEIRKHLQ